ncbi:hypothetical protein EUGRSUZ_D00801 [Eucalyptus grandis]|uniref:Uncharacterized protein n=1 Tax=Eucalyptus grandis TaxID=71139 RepID=A0A059CE32_EUCGR|nr:hypothetical protein EUGRSUZ_D00801 [Eucalyptus grandis]
MTSCSASNRSSNSTPVSSPAAECQLCYQSSARDNPPNHQKHLHHSKQDCHCPGASRMAHSRPQLGSQTSNSLTHFGETLILASSAPTLPINW